MGKFLISLKQILSRGTGLICRNAKRLAKAIRYKVHEVNDLRKRRKLIRRLGEAVYKLNGDGLVLPAEATDLVKEITLPDSDLCVLRTERASQKAEDAQRRAAEKAAIAAEKATAKTAAAIEMSTAAVQVDALNVEQNVIAAAQEPQAPTLEMPAEPKENHSDDVPTLKM